MQNRFDAYNPTFPGVEPEQFIPALKDHFGDLLTAEEILGRKHGYTGGLLLRLGDFDLCRVLFGGNNGAAMHCEAKGFLTPRWVDFVRTNYPGKHYLTRVDVCIDLDEEGAFSRCLDAALDVMRKYDLTENMQGDWIKAEKGRTYYLGSRSSLAFLRIYEKGKKDDPTRPNWVRMELEIKPPPKWEPMRRYFASLEPEKLWGVCDWTADLYERVTGLNMRVLERPTTPKTNYDKRLEWLAMQAHSALADVVAKVGEAALWSEIQRAREEAEKRKRKAA